MGIAGCEEKKKKEVCTTRTESMKHYINILVYEEILIYLFIHIKVRIFHPPPFLMR